MKKSYPILLFLEVLLLFQQLGVILLFFRRYPWLTFVDFVVTTVFSLFIIVLLLFDRNAIKKRLVYIGLILAYYTIFFINLERLYFSHYYVVLLNYNKTLELAVKEKDYTKLIRTSDILSVNSNEGVLFFYFEKDHPSFGGIAYSKDNTNPKITGLGLEHITVWGKLWGDWYYWKAIDPY